MADDSASSKGVSRSGQGAKGSGSRGVSTGSGRTGTVSKSSTSSGRDDRQPSKGTSKSPNNARTSSSGRDDRQPSAGTSAKPNNAPDNSQSALMKEANRRNDAAVLAGQYSQYRSPPGAESNRVFSNSMPGNSDPDLNYGRGTPVAPQYDGPARYRPDAFNDNARMLEFGGYPVSHRAITAPNLVADRDVSFGDPHSVIQGYPSAAENPGEYANAHAPLETGFQGPSGGVVSAPGRENPNPLGDLMASISTLFNLGGADQPTATTVKPFQDRARPFAGFEDTVDPLYSPPRTTMKKQITDRLPQEEPGVYGEPLSTLTEKTQLETPAHVVAQNYGFQSPPSRASNSIFGAPADSPPIPRQNPLRNTDLMRGINTKNDVFDTSSDFGTIDGATLSRLVSLQQKYGKPLTVTEGSAPFDTHAKRSQHHINPATGKSTALDVSVPTGDRAELVRMANEVGFGGIGAYGANLPNMVHVDTGPTRSWGPEGRTANIAQLSDKELQAALTQRRPFSPKIAMAGDASPPKPNVLDNVARPFATKAVNTVKAATGNVVKGFNSIFNPNGEVPIPRQKPVRPQARRDGGESNGQAFWNALYQNSRGAVVG